MSQCVIVCEIGPLSEMYDRGQMITCGDGLLAAANQQRTAESSSPFGVSGG